MHIDNKTLKSLSAMNDDELKKFISSAANKSGVALPTISRSDIARIRAVLAGASSGNPDVIKAMGDISDKIKKEGWDIPHDRQK